MQLLCYNYTITGDIGKQVCLAFYGAKEVSTKTTLAITCNGITREYYYAPKGDLMCSEQRDFYLNFGAFSSNETNVEITIIEGKSLSLKKVEQVITPATFFALETLKSVSHLENLVRNKKSISGEITTLNDGWLFLSIPYFSGWKAEIDNKHVEIISADTAFMAIKMSSVEHFVQHTYTTPYLKSGIYISASSLAVMVGTATVYELKRKTINFR